MSYQPKNSLFKFKKLREITYENILASATVNPYNSCFARNFKQVIDEYGTDFGKMSFERIIDACINHILWLDWLTSHNFIVRSNIPFSLNIGDIVNYRKQLCIISSDGEHIDLISLKNGSWVSSTDYEDFSDDEALMEIFNLTSIFDPELGKMIRTKIPAGEILNYLRKTKNRKVKSNHETKKRKTTKGKKTKESK
jgi:hypothetical protein